MGQLTKLRQGGDTSSSLGSRLRVAGGPSQPVQAQSGQQLLQQLQGAPAEQSGQPGSQGASSGPPGLAPDNAGTFLQRLQVRTYSSDVWQRLGDIAVQEVS